MVILAAAVLCLPVRVDASGDPLPPGALARCGTVRWRVPGGALHVAYSPDGKLVAASGTADSSVILFDSLNGRVIRRFEPDERPCYLLFSPDGKSLAVHTGTAEPRVQLLGHRRMTLVRLQIPKIGDFYKRRLGPGACKNPQP
jgi:hypothetical protein